MAELTTLHENPMLAQLAPLPTWSDISPSKAAIEQRGSRLMRLPGEIRNIILRHLLTTNMSIGSEFRYDDRDNPTASQARFRGVRQRWGQQLTPSILRTCQQLLHEGLSLLYGENSMDVKITMNILLPQRQNPWFRVPPIVSGPYAEALQRPWGEKVPRSVLDEPERSEHVAFIERFCNIKLYLRLEQINATSSSDLRSSLVTMVPTFNHRNITLRVCDVPYVYFPKDWLLSHLEALEELRCKTIGITYTPQTYGGAITQSDITRVERMITGDITQQPLQTDNA